MNQQQRTYAIGRINSIVGSRLDKVTAKHTQVAVTLSRAERLTEFVAKRWVMVDGITGISSYDNLDEIITFKKEKRKVINKDAISKEMSLVVIAAEDAKDRIMLGDTEAALKLLEAFYLKYSSDE